MSDRKWGCCPNCGEALPQTDVHRDVTVTGGFTIYGFLHGGNFTTPTTVPTKDRIGADYRGDVIKILFPTEAR